MIARGSPPAAIALLAALRWATAAGGWGVRSREHAAVAARVGTRWGHENGRCAPLTRGSHGSRERPPTPRRSREVRH